MNKNKYSFRISSIGINNFNIKEVHVNEDGKLIKTIAVSYLKNIYHGNFTRSDDEAGILREACNWLIEKYPEEFL